MTSERCVTFREELAAFRADALEPTRAAEHTAHMAACPACAAAHAADAELDDLLAELPTPDTDHAAARLQAEAAALSSPTPGPAAPLPWGWIVGVGFALAAALSADWGRTPPAPPRARDPWRYHAPPELDRDELPLDTDQPAAENLTWRVL